MRANRTSWAGTSLISPDTYLNGIPLKYRLDSYKSGIIYLYITDNKSEVEILKWNLSLDPHTALKICIKDVVATRRVVSTYIFILDSVSLLFTIGISRKNGKISSNTTTIFSVYFTTF